MIIIILMNGIDQMMIIYYNNFRLQDEIDLDSKIQKF
jgi:hypothetical protein